VPRTAAILALAALLAVCQAGCTGLEPAAVSAGATAAQSGITILERGKARSYELARYPDVVAAMKLAAGRLGLAQTIDEVGEARARMVFKDDHGDSIVAVVERRTGSITLVQTDVGVLGATGMGTLLLNQTFAEIARAGHYLDAWDRSNPRDGGAGALSP
jgi:hypothetical protein